MPNRNIVGDYRYTYQGQEKDPETGMEAFELRLWDNRIGRWITTDPYGQFHSPYLGMGNNPINGFDVDGGIFIIHYKDKNGKNRIYEYGKIYGPLDEVPDNQFVKDFIAAYEYNVANGGGQNMTEIYNSTDVLLDVRDVHSSQLKMTRDRGSSNYDDGTLWWNSRLGLENPKGDVLSPATIAEHETGHAVRNLIQGRIQGGSHDSYAIDAENCTAMCNGEIRVGTVFRYGNQHENYAIPVFTESATSNKVDVNRTLDFLRTLLISYPNVSPIKNLTKKYEEVSRSPRYH